MKPGDLVCWKYRYEMNLVDDCGIILEKHFPTTYDPFPWWVVKFSSQGIVKCRDTDLVVL